MQFGTFVLMQSPDGEPSQEMYARAVDVAQAAEDLGYHTLWLAEHHFSSYGYLSRPLMMAAHIAARTKRVRIGTAVIVAPLHNPLVLAEEVATADLLSQGRLDVGLGRGYQPYEFKRFGMTLDDNRERWEEAADILVKALTQESFSHQGKYHSFDDTAVLPRPVQKPHPPIWDAAQSLGSITAAVRRGFSIMTSGAGAPFETIVDFRRAFDEAVDQFKPEVTPTFAITEKIYVADDEEDALNTSKEALWNMRVSVGLRAGTLKVERGGLAVAEPYPTEPNQDDLMERYLLFGTPDHCIEKVRRLRDEAKVDHLICNAWHSSMSHEKVLRSLERFSREVMPHFQDQITAIHEPAAASADD